jgi:hypothetical protein
MIDRRATGARWWLSRQATSIIFRLSRAIEQYRPSTCRPAPARIQPACFWRDWPSGCRGKREGFCSNAPHRGLCVSLSQSQTLMDAHVVSPLSILLGCATRSHFPCFEKRHFVDFPMSFCALGSRHAGLSSTSFLHTYTITGGPLSGPCSCLSVCMYVQGISCPPVRRQLASARHHTHAHTHTHDQCAGG